MRTALFFVAALALLTPAVAQEEADEGAWPAAEISSDIAALPAAVQAKRAALIAAARSGDIAALEPIIDGQHYAPNVSFGNPDDALQYLKDVSEDDEGRQILGLLLDLFDQPYAFHPDIGDGVFYVWPYLAELDPSAFTPAQTVDAYRLLNRDQIAELTDFGAWYYWRIVISDSGEWLAFVAGD